MMRAAKGGGSVTPEYKRILLDLMKSGRVEMREATEVESAVWHADGEEGMWNVTTTKGEEFRGVHHVVYATGVSADVNKVSALKDMMKEFPVETVGGLPVLTQDLMWNAQVPLFITGRLAGLRIGPGAGNLEGARQGSERIAWKVGSLLSAWEEDSGYEGSEGSEDGSWGGNGVNKGDVDMRRIGLGGGNQFAVLES